MSVTKRQFDLLQAMGIAVWQRRELPVQASQPCQVAPKSNANETTTSITPKNQQLTATTASAELNQTAPEAVRANIDLQALLEQQLFNDVIQCLGTSRADLSVQNHQIDLGLINWEFGESNNIEFSHNCLRTPDLDTIANSPQLKKALWHSIGPLSST